MEATLPVLHDLDELAHRAYGAAGPAMYCIRPDGHVGARVSPAEIGQLRRYAEQWIRRSSPAAKGDRVPLAEAALPA